MRLSLAKLRSGCKVHLSLAKTRSGCKMHPGLTVTAGEMDTAGASASALPAGCVPAWTDTTTTPFFTPHGSQCTSTPIPLGSVQWNWSACAINALAANGTGGTTPNWNLYCGTGSGITTGVTSGYPEWSPGTGPGGCYKSPYANCQ